MLIIIPVCFGDEKPLDSEKEMAVKTIRNPYRIGSGDILEIVTWKEPDFSREEVLVRTDGQITFPLIGDIQAAGKTTLQLAKDIETGLKRFVENPVVTVTLKSPVSHKFYILGEIANTGEYNLVKELTVLQAFALAGGFYRMGVKEGYYSFQARKRQGKDYKNKL